MPLSLETSSNPTPTALDTLADAMMVYGGQLRTYSLTRQSNAYTPPLFSQKPEISGRNLGVSRIVSLGAIKSFREEKKNV